MRSPTLMLQGTMSSVGKSLLVAAFCRLFKAAGLRVAPFKAQNMALNSYATHDGFEVGRAQAMQAAAAGIEVTAAMNPVLIKPEADSFAQIIVMGKPWARLPAHAYYQKRNELWGIVTNALDSLRETYDLVVIEGAGSPVELNLRQNDIVNMAVANYADSPVLLVGDIDRGGIFAQLLGTLMLLEEKERVRGFLVNKFRGDRNLFTEGINILEEKGKIPVLGVIPFIRNLRLPDEDSVALDDLQPQPNLNKANLELAVIRLPHLSNFDDFDALRAESNVFVSFVESAKELDSADLIILPGTKTTIADLRFLRERGLASRIIALAQEGRPILGICGGYQILGKMIFDPNEVESAEKEVQGLGLLPVSTTFVAEKQTLRSQGKVFAKQGLFANAQNLPVAGYEIHSGYTNFVGAGQPLLQVTRRGETSVNESDGAIAPNGWIAGTYFHGLFENDELRHQLLQNVANLRGKVWESKSTTFDREESYTYLAETVRQHLDWEKVWQLVHGF